MMMSSGTNSVPAVQNTRIVSRKKNTFDPPYLGRIFVFVTLTVLGYVSNAQHKLFLGPVTSRCFSRHYRLGYLYGYFMDVCLYECVCGCVYSYFVRFPVRIYIFVFNIRTRIVNAWQPAYGVDRFIYRGK